MIEKQKEKQSVPFATAFPFGPATEKTLRIVFMGTPEFAVASLNKLVLEGYNVVGVITAPDKQAGRGLEVQQSAVKKYAVQHGLNILQPEKLKDIHFLDELRSLQADLQVVVAFRMLPEVVWNMPAMGTINVHGSLLPQYRGAAPINRAIINGEKLTGVTTFKLQQQIDTGDILLQCSLPIGDDDDAGTLHDAMKDAGAELLVQTIRGLETGSLKPAAQEQPADIRHAPKIFTETCKINWESPVAEVYNLIRGLSPYPAAFTTFEQKKLKIFKARKILSSPAVAMGQYETDGKTFLRFACSDGFLDVIELQLEGKKKMLTGDFLRGYRFA